MINRVLLAGRIVQEPTVEETSRPRVAVMSLLVTHPEWNSDDLEETCMDILIYGEGRIEMAAKYLEQGRDLLVTGRLTRRNGQAVVVLEQLQFMLRNLTTRYFWNEAFLEEAAAA